MGAVCPCLAGVEKAAGGQPEASKPNAPLIESKPVLEPKAAPAQATPVPVPAPAAVQAPEPKALPPQAEAEKAPVPQVVAAPSAAAAPAPAAAGGITEPLSMGSCLEVYSNSYNAWCPGVVYGIDSSAILVAYQVQDEAEGASISTKTVAIDTTEIRLPTPTGSWLTASVEVYSHSNKVWCAGKVTENVNDVLSVVFFYPNEPPDAIPVRKQLPLGSEDLRLVGIDAAFQFVSTPGVGHDSLQVNSAVEVYSNSLSVWCTGIVQELKEGVATVAFYYPDMDPATESPAVKEVPLGHQDLRVPGYATGGAYNAGPPVTEADIVLGGTLEVFSQSRGVWITTQVKEVVDGTVTVLLRYPDMPEDSELYEKNLPIGHQDMRLPGTA